MSETTAQPSPTLPAYTDFTHRDYRPDHTPTPTRKGIPYPENMSSQKAAKLLNKVATKPHLRNRPKMHGPRKKKKTT